MSLLDKATIITTPTAHSNGVLHSIKGGAVADFDVVRGSLATRVNAEGLIEDVAANIPRIDYTDGTASILLEPQSTNIAKHSEQLNTVPNVVDGANYVSNFYVAPNGLTEAPKFEETTANDRHGFYQYQPVTSGSYTVSIYTKQFDRRYISLQSDITGSSQFTFFDLQAGDVVSEGTGWSATIDAVGDNGWYRLSATCTAVSGTRFVIFGGSLDGLSNTYVGDGSLFTFWGLQLEALPYSTSYVPTSGAIATRLADSVTGAGDATTFNDSEGVLYAEMASLANDLTARRLTICDGSNNNRVFIGYSTSSNSIQFVIQSLGALVVNSTFSISDITQFSKIAIKYKENDCSFWIDGVKVGTDTTASMPTGLNTLLFDDGDTTRPLFGKVKSVITFDTALTDAELECLTTI